MGLAEWVASSIDLLRDLVTLFYDLLIFRLFSFLFYRVIVYIIDIIACG